MKKESAAIDYLLQQPGYQGGVVYGRRRLGKTELLKHCLLGHDVPTIIYQRNQESDSGNARDLADEIKKVFGLTHLSFSSFEETVRFVFKESRKREIFFAIDEYLIFGNSILASILSFKGSSVIIIIAATSSFSFRGAASR